MFRLRTVGVAILAMAVATGCASTPQPSQGPSPGGITYRDDDKLGKVWLAPGFKFTGYDTLHIADTKADVAKLNPDGVESLEWAKGVLREELVTAIRAAGFFGSVVARESDIKPGSRVLKLENTIIEYEKGGGAARYFAGLYGAGQPVIKVRGRMSEGDRLLFVFEERRRGDSASARILGGFRSNRDIQTEDIQSLAKDLAEFIIRISKN